MTNSQSVSCFGGKRIKINEKIKERILLRERGTAEKSEEVVLKRSWQKR